MNQPGTEADVPISQLVLGVLLPDRHPDGGKPTIIDRNSTAIFIFEGLRPSNARESRQQGPEDHDHLGVRTGRCCPGHGRWPDQPPAFASPEVDAMLDDEHSYTPFHYFLASAFLVRLEQDEDFASDSTEWYDGRLQGEAGRREDQSWGSSPSLPTRSGIWGTSHVSSN